MVPQIIWQALSQPNGARNCEPPRRIRRSSYAAVPDSISDEIAVFTEPIAAACEILDQVQPPSGARIAVLGDGKLGLLIAQVLQSHGFRVHQFGRHEEKLRIAQAAGVETDLVRDKMPRMAYDWVIEATGSAEGLRTAVDMVRPRSVVVMKSTLHGTVPVDTAPVIVNEITLIGSRCGRFEPALHLLESGIVNVAGMISDRMRLKDASQAFARAGEKGVLKVLLSAD